MASVPATPDLVEPAAAQDWPARSKANYALAILIVAFAFSFLDRVILSMVMIPVQKEMSFSDTQLALLHGFAFAIFYAVAGFPLGRIADRGSRRILIAIGIAVWSLCTAACGLARSFLTLFLARVGVGVGEAALSPAAFSILSDYFRPEVRARAIATYQLGVVLGSGLAYIVGGLVIAFASSGRPIDVPLLGELTPWRVTFLLVGLPGLLIALLAMTIAEPERRGGASSEGADLASTRAWLSQNRATITCFALGYGCINITFGAVIAWVPTWLARSYGLAPMAIGLVLGLAMLGAGSIGQLLGAWRSDRRFGQGERTATFDTGLLCALMLVPLSAATVMPGLLLAVPMVAGLIFFTCGAIGHAPSLVAQIAPNRMRGQIAALYLFAVNLIGTGLGPLIVALLTENVFGDPARVGASIALTSATGALAGAVLLFVGRSALARSVRARVEE